MANVAPVDERLEANRASWDERTAVHLESRFYDVEGWLRDRRGPRPRELEALGDVSGLKLLHLQCHFGLDTLSLARMGASLAESVFTTEWQPMQTCVGGTIAFAARSMFAWQ